MIPWAQFSAYRLPWEPSNPKPKSETSKYPGTISPAIALRKLEIPVQGFIKEGLERSDKAILGDGVAVLTQNMKDEDKHDKTLTGCFNALSNYEDSVTEEANNFIQEWIDHPDHPITKAAVLETGVFFVLLPIMQRYGTVSMIEAAKWISGDERGHVNSHRQAAELLKAGPSRSLHKLRRDTVAWMTKNMNEEIKPGSTDHWLRASDTLITEGKSTLKISKVFSMPALFEIGNDKVVEYV